MPSKHAAALARAPAGLLGALGWGVWESPSGCCWGGRAFGEEEDGGVGGGLSRASEGMPTSCSLRQGLVVGLLTPWAWPPGGLHNGGDSSHSSVWHGPLRG